MTINRNIHEDRRKTAERIVDRSKHEVRDGKNWLGHREYSGAACIDEKLLDGASLDELLKCRGAVEEHIFHLKNEHGLLIIEGALKKFDWSDLGI